MVCSRGTNRSIRTDPPLPRPPVPGIGRGGEQRVQSRLEGRPVHIEGELNVDKYRDAAGDYTHRTHVTWSPPPLSSPHPSSDFSSRCKFERNAGKPWRLFGFRPALFLKMFCLSVVYVPRPLNRPDDTVSLCSLVNIMALWIVPVRSIKLILWYCSFAAVCKNWRNAVLTQRGYVNVENNVSSPIYQ